MAPVPQANRQEQAVRLRDVCLELVKTHGERRDMSGYVVTQVALKPFTIWLTPWRHQTSLDIWYDGAGKVLTLRLKDSDIDILGFRRGRWEGDLLTLARSD